jgi:hypothetical protein
MVLFGEHLHKNVPSFQVHKLAHLFKYAGFLVPTCGYEEFYLLGCQYSETCLMLTASLAHLWP